MRLSHLIVVFLICFSCKAQEEMQKPVATSEHFDFYNNVWINQHHFLFQVAKNKKKEDLTDDADFAIFSGLSEDEKQKGVKAIAYYQAELIDKDLLFNGTLYQMKIQLTNLPDHAKPKEPAFDPVLAEVWQDFFPIYQKHFWPKHKAQNELILNQNLDRIKAYEAVASKRLSQLSQNNWPNEKIRVDITYHANWAGAYTTTNPVHIVTSTSNTSLEGDWIETLFHEAGHGLIGGRRGAVSATISRIAQNSELEIPRQLWHGILFYFAGRVIQDLLQEEGVSYELFMVREKVFYTYFESLQAHMEPYVQGETSLEAAIEKLMISLQK